MNKPFVSVCMLTYKHESMIAQAIEGVLMQECNFNIELVISNDCSPDDTDSIINKIVKSHPKAKIIKYTRHSENLGMMPNHIWALKQCKGKYIALCEGDDYWTDPLKLQKQVNFLEAHPECSFCFTRAEQVYTGIDKKSFIYPDKISKNVLTAAQYLDIPTTATPSLMFNNLELNKGIEFIMPNHSHPDFIIYCNLLQHGMAGVLNDITCVYRKHTKGNSFEYNSENYLYRRINELRLEKEAFTHPEVKKAIHKRYIQHLHNFLIKYPLSNKVKEIKNNIDVDKQYWLDRLRIFFRMLKNKIKTYL